MQQSGQKSSAQNSDPKIQAFNVTKTQPRNREHVKRDASFFAKLQFDLLFSKLAISDC